MLSGPDVVYLETEKQEFIDWLVEGYQFRVKQVPDLTKWIPQFIKISVYRETDVEAHTRELREKYSGRIRLPLQAICGWTV